MSHGGSPASQLRFPASSSRWAADPLAKVQREGSAPPPPLRTETPEESTKILVPCAREEEIQILGVRLTCFFFSKKVRKATILGHFKAKPDFPAQNTRKNFFCTGRGGGGHLPWEPLPGGRGCRPPFPPPHHLIPHGGGSSGNYSGALPSSGSRQDPPWTPHLVLTGPRRRGPASTLFQLVGQTPSPQVLRKFSVWG